jgi:apolipoprotein N-acyltransferase
LSSPIRYATVAALVAGAFAALVGPPTNLYPALWVGLAALAYLLDTPPPSTPGRLRRWFDGAGRGLAFGFGVNVVFLRFVPPTVQRFTTLPFAAGGVFLVLLAALQGFAWCVVGVVHRQLARLGVPPWLSFGIGVYVGTFSPAVFLWSPAGLLTPVPSMVQLAEIVGERGVTLLMAWSAGLLAAAFRSSGPGKVSAPPRSRPPLLPSALYLAAGLGLPMLAFVFGQMRIARVEADRSRAPSFKVGLVEPSIDAVARWDNARASAILASLTKLTESSESQGVDLTVWPESAYPHSFPRSSATCSGGARPILTPGVHGPVLSGFLMVGGGEQWNSAAVCASDGTLTPPEDKLRLLAFGEKIPLVGDIRWVRKVFARGTGLSAGTHNVVQASGPMRASVLICVEDTLADAGRQAMADRPNLLVNLTNDAWFQGSHESELHLRIAALRSVESRRDMIRAVNFGPTTWVDAAGIVRARYDSDAPGVLVATPALLEGDLTLFDRLGDLPTEIALALVAIFGTVRGRRRASPRDARALTPALSPYRGEGDVDARKGHPLPPGGRGPG